MENDAENEQELSREDQGLDPEPQDGPGDVENLPEEDFDSYAEDDVEVADSPPVPATDTAPPERSLDDTVDEAEEGEDE